MPADPALPFSSSSAPDQPYAALLVDHLTFRYRDRPEPSIVDISLRVGVGELVLLAGASGSGKTT
ncbi:MAG: hypothetical protein MUE67_10630, partial [Anaerolineales bacterium]|nr:hypothetical protein [Anaerolineales bacterium]